MQTFRPAATENPSSATRNHPDPPKVAQVRFYCGAHLPANNPIDHVLPWSLVGIDGLANLVLACARCNTDKASALPAVAIIERVLDRDRAVLEQIGSEISWPTQHERVVAAARGIYRAQPAGVPTWSGYKQTQRLDIGFVPSWARLSQPMMGSSLR
ncbi:CRISPR-associated endonuclease Cas9 [Mycobacterium heckeshornense]|nr:CRISPR-associated endonuclease Cas9 [Mycobacterium heckeshornense]